jgi:glycosyltransferase involved in cell wall biosynthesis
MKMRVGIDAMSWPNRRGYGRFARNAVSRLIALDPQTTYVLYIDEQSADSVELPGAAIERRVRLRHAPSRAAAAGSSRPAADLLRLTIAAWRDSLDAFLFPSVYTYFPVVSVPTVVGVHDAISEQFPELTVPDRRSRLLMGAKMGLALRTASRLFTVSETSRAVLAQRYGLSPEALRVVPEAPDPVFGPRPNEPLRQALEPFDLDPHSYFVFAGGISPHKNIGTLLDAYARLLEAHGEVPPLVLVGELESDPFLSAASEVRHGIESLGLQDHVRLPGFVSDEALACLYAGATAVALPSLAEGFGLPAVEAAACGTATVLSDIPAHRETIGDSALYFPPTDASALAECLRQVMSDPGLRRRLGDGGRAAVARFSWDTTAKGLCEVLAEVAGATAWRRSRPWQTRQLEGGRRVWRGAQ